MSKLFSLNTKDLIKGAAVTAITTLVASIVVFLDDNQLPTIEELKSALFFSLIAGVSYLLKNFITDDRDKIGGVV
jgi:hypothetical protein